jgi:hypothetical protein
MDSFSPEILSKNIINDLLGMADDYGLDLRGDSVSSYLSDLLKKLN